jgi:cellulose synthase/poly-beta-1,6-N-acetylglucosamine synthase-like glycosyltransferase
MLRYPVTPDNLFFWYPASGAAAGPLFLLAFILVALPIFLSVPLHRVLMRWRWHHTRPRSPVFDELADEPEGGWPELTCIVPVANEAETIECRIAQLLASYPKEKLHILVVLNNSSDATREICRRLSVGIIESPPGKMKALETGWEAAATEFILASDCDVAHDETVIQKLVAALIRCENEVCAIAASCAFSVSRNTRLTRQMAAYERRYSLICHVHGEIHSAIMLQGPMTLYRKSALPEFPGNACEDELSMGIAILRAGKRALMHPKAWVQQPVPEKMSAILMMRVRHVGRQIYTCLANLDLPFRRGTGFTGRVVFPCYMFFPRCLPWITLLLLMAPWMLEIPFYMIYLPGAALFAVLAALRPFAALQLLALHFGWIYLLLLPYKGSSWKNTR